MGGSLGKPYELLVSSGATYKNRKRYMDRGIVDSPALGAPPENLAQDEREEWDRLIDEIPWLKECHRATVEIAAVIRRRVRSGVATVQEMKFMLQLMAALGATPTSENRIPPGYFKTENDEDDNPFN